MNLKKIWLYYLLLFSPFILFFFLRDNINSTLFVLGLIVYGFIYHPIISGLRLLQSGKIERSKFWYNLIPGWNSKYFMFLFFNK